ncbi:MAG: fumarylacetoacetate hydrolase family protein [Pelomonas sp.]|nr:fumarylacetoacetate hydrolase family protein [Roseateles sp.]
MSQYIFTPPETPSVAVRGSDQRYAVARIFCVGRNYAAHAREMGSDPTRESPFYFTKPPVALTPSGATVPYALATRNLHHEMELVVAVGAPLLRATPAQAAKAVWGYAAGLDMTRRDLQNEAKAAGRPWDTGKSFEHSAVIGEFVPAIVTGPLERGAITLAVNGVEKQRGDLADMIWSVPELLANLSQLYHLAPGDIVYTGTPEGVGPVVAGDVITGHIEGLGDIRFTLSEAE